MINNIKTLATSILLMVFVLISASPNSGAYNLNNRSIDVANTEVSALTDHKFGFSLSSAVPLGSIVFEYCDNPLPSMSCIAPVGLDTSLAILSSQSGETGFTIYSATSNTIIISRAVVPANIVPVTYDFSNITNPSTYGTFNVRISTYDSVDGTGSYIDRGSVVSSTSRGIAITTEVPPILQFCVGVTIPTDCSSASGYSVQLGELKSNQTRSATSQMIGGTNADFGYIITASGTTMASGTNEINSMTNRAGSTVGSSQFGINLRANSSPGVGSDPSGTGIATPTSEYNVPNQYKFVSGDTIASSTDETNQVKFTTSYIVNVPNSQPPGVYTNTITYLCVATF